MKYTKNYYILICLFVLANIYGCTVHRTQSGFDNNDVIKMDKLAIKPNSNISMSLYWDSTMPKDQSLATFYLRGDFKAANNTSINIRVGNEKFKFQPLGAENLSKIETSRNLMTNQMNIQSANELQLPFYLSDDVLKKMSTIKNFLMMITLANNVRIEEEANYFSIGSDLKSFYKAKYHE